MLLQRVVLPAVSGDSSDVQARLRDDLNRLPDHHFYACIENIVIARDESAAHHTDPDYDLDLETLDAPSLRALQVRLWLPWLASQTSTVLTAACSGLLRGVAGTCDVQACLQCLATCPERCWHCAAGWRQACDCLTQPGYVQPLYLCAVTKWCLDLYASDRKDTTDISPATEWVGCVPCATIISCPRNRRRMFQH